MTSAEALLQGYFDLEDPRRLEPAEREQTVEVVLDGGLRLRGIVDRLDVAPDGPGPRRGLQDRPRPGELFEGKALFQMKFYALVIWRTRGQVPALLQLMYLGDREVLRYVPDEADLRATERKLLALWQAVEQAVQRRSSRRGRAGCATGATTRRCAPPSVAHPRPSPPTPPRGSPARRAHRSSPVQPAG